MAKTTWSLGMCSAPSEPLAVQASVPRGQGSTVTTGPEATLCAGHWSWPSCYNKGDPHRAWSRVAWVGRPTGLQISVWTSYLTWLSTSVFPSLKWG